MDMRSEAPHRLSALLVQYNLASVAQIKDGLIRQAVEGGSLDTALLERLVLSEGVVLDLLARATGFFPASSELLANGDQGVAEFVDSKKAAALRCCPLYYSTDGLVVIVQEDTDRRALRDLADRISESLVCYVSTELRVVQARSRIYGETLPERYAKLVASYGVEPARATQPQRIDVAAYGELPEWPSELAIVQPPSLWVQRARQARSGVVTVAEERPRLHDLRSLPFEEALAGIDEAQTRDDALTALIQGLAPIGDRVALLTVRNQSVYDHLAYDGSFYGPRAQDKPVASISDSRPLWDAARSATQIVEAADYDDVMLRLVGSLERGKRAVVIPIRVLHKSVALAVVMGESELLSGASDAIEVLTLNTGRVLTRVLAERKRTKELVAVQSHQHETSSSTAASTPPN